MRATTWQTEPKVRWRSPEMNAEAKTLLDNEHDGVRALLLVLFYGGLIILYACVSLAKQVAQVIGHFRGTPSVGARLAWLAGEGDSGKKLVLQSRNSS